MVELVTMIIELEKVQDFSVVSRGLFQQMQLPVWRLCMGGNGNLSLLQVSGSPHWSMTSDLFPVDAVIGVGPVFTEIEFIFLPLSPSPAAVPFFL